MIRNDKIRINLKKNRKSDCMTELLSDSSKLPGRCCCLESPSQQNLLYKEIKIQKINSYHHPDRRRSSPWSFVNRVFKDNIHEVVISSQSSRYLSPFIYMERNRSIQVCSGKRFIKIWMKWYYETKGNGIQAHLRFGPFDPIVASLVLNNGDLAWI